MEHFRYSLVYSRKYLIQRPRIQGMPVSLLIFLPDLVVTKQGHLDRVLDLNGELIHKKVHNSPTIIF